MKKLNVCVCVCVRACVFDLHTEETETDSIQKNCVSEILQESSLQSYLEKLPLQTKVKYYRFIYTDQNYKCNSFCPIFHELNSKI